MVAWTEKRVSRLTVLYKEGFSASAIAKKLGPAFTKAMVAGKIRRLGLSAKTALRGRPESKKPIAPEQRAVNGKATQTPAPRSKTPAIMLPASAPGFADRTGQPPTCNGLLIYDLREGHCRWPLGNDRPAKFFCGAPTVPSKAWCEHHYRMAYGHGPKHQDHCHEKSPAQMLLRALRGRSKPRRLIA